MWCIAIFPPAQRYSSVIQMLMLNDINIKFIVHEGNIGEEKSLCAVQTYFITLRQVLGFFFAFFCCSSPFTQI